MTAPVVVLLHGWWSGPWELWRLERALKRAGYRVANLGYPCVRIPLERLAAEVLPRRLRETLPPSSGPVHFVTHSMGGLLLREYLRRLEPGSLDVGRIVMIAPPNQGSELADGPHWAMTRWLAGPNRDRLRSGPDDLPRRLPSAGELPGEFGIIAGSFSWWPTRRLPRPHDGRVSVASTRLRGSQDHCVIRSSHTALPWNGRVVRQVERFLATGTFERDPMAD